jgi:hypothetical protein
MFNIPSFFVLIVISVAYFGTAEITKIVVLESGAGAERQILH